MECPVGYKWDIAQGRCVRVAGPPMQVKTINLPPYVGTLLGFWDPVHPDRGRVGPRSEGAVPLVKRPNGTYIVDYSPLKISAPVSMPRRLVDPQQYEFPLVLGRQTVPIMDPWTGGPLIITLWPSETATDLTTFAGERNIQSPEGFWMDPIAVDDAWGISLRTLALGTRTTPSYGPSQMIGSVIFEAAIPVTSFDQASLGPAGQGMRWFRNDRDPTRIVLKNLRGDPWKAEPYATFPEPGRIAEYIQGRLISGTIDYLPDANGFIDRNGDHWSVIDDTDALNVQSLAALYYSERYGPMPPGRRLSFYPPNEIGVQPFAMWRRWLDGDMDKPPHTRIVRHGQVIRGSNLSYSNVSAYDFNYIFAMFGNWRLAAMYLLLQQTAQALGALGNWDLTNRVLKTDDGTLNIAEPGYIWLNFSPTEATPVPPAAGGILAGDFIAFLETGGRGDALVRQLPGLVASGQLGAVLAKLSAERHSGGMFSSVLGIATLAIGVIGLVAGIIAPLVAGIEAAAVAGEAAGIAGVTMGASIADVAAIAAAEAGMTLGEAGMLAAVEMSSVAFTDAAAIVGAEGLAELGSLSIESVSVLAEAEQGGLMLEEVAFEGLVPELQDQTIFDAVQDMYGQFSELKKALDPMQLLPDEIRPVVSTLDDARGLYSDINDVMSRDRSVGQVSVGIPPPPTTTIVPTATHPPSAPPPPATASPAYLGPPVPAPVEFPAIGPPTQIDPFTGEIIPEGEMVPGTGGAGTAGAGGAEAFAPGLAAPLLVLAGVLLFLGRKGK